MKFSLPKKFPITPSNLTIGATLLLLPLLTSLLFFSLENQKIEENYEKLLVLQKINKKQEEKNIFLINNSKPDYLENTLKSLSFLKNEKQKWKIFLSQIEPSPSMKEQASFLEEGGNSLEFEKGESKKGPIFIETILKQKKPVELNKDDLKSLLCLIENVSIPPYTPKIGIPQLLITSFELKKKNIFETEEKVYSLEMQLIKREKSKAPTLSKGSDEIH